MIDPEGPFLPNPVYFAWGGSFHDWQDCMLVSWVWVKSCHLVSFTSPYLWTLGPHSQVIYSSWKREPLLCCFFPMSLRPPPSVGRSRQGPLQHRAAGRWPPPGQTCLRVTEAARPPRFTDALPRARDPVVALSVVRAATGCRVSWSVIDQFVKFVWYFTRSPLKTKLCYFLIGDDFLNMIPRVEAARAKMSKWDSTRPHNGWKIEHPFSWTPPVLTTDGR